jgi:hypothetical protein
MLSTGCEAGALTGVLRPSIQGTQRRAVAGILIALLILLALSGVLGASGHSAPAPAARARGLSHGSLLSVPLAARAPVSATLGAASSAYRVSAARAGFAAASPAQHLNVRFASSGIAVASGTTRLDLSLRAAGYGASLTALGASVPRARANRVAYEYPGLRSWYVNGPLGLEQGFTIARAPSRQAAGPLTLAMTLSGAAHASLSRGAQSLTLAEKGGPSLRYGELRATDASGRVLHSWLALDGRQLLVRVDAQGARYPLRIDPLIQQGEKLTGGSESSEFGYSVALSADGETALVGDAGYGGEVGAAWIFVRSGSTWTQQGEKLTPNGATGRFGARFGFSVALSADGNTAMIGGPHDKSNPSLGAVWVFTRSGTTWTQGPSLLTANSQTEGQEFGWSVVLSADGNTALIGGANAYWWEQGAAWVFTRSGETWTQQGEALTSGGGSGQAGFGESLALSADGNTALIGNPADNGELGSASVFTRSGETWSQQGAKLTGGGETGTYADFGHSVALSADGNTALIGGEADDHDIGAAWVFTRSEETWAQQGEKLTASEEIGEGNFGSSVALSSDGNTALIGGYYDNKGIGAAWEFTRSGSTWTQQGEKLTAKDESGNGLFGWRVALSSEANTALITGIGDANNRGAAWAFVSKEPTVPAIVTTSASEIRTSSAQLNGTVNPEGWEVTECDFEYGLSEEYPSRMPCGALTGSGMNPVAVSATIEGLRPLSTYHFRIVAKNANGTSYGSDQTFETLPNPPGVVTGSASAISQTSASVSARVNPEGGEVNDCYFEYTTYAGPERAPCSSLPGAGTEPAAVSGTVEGLSAHTVYRFRIVAGNAGGMSYGEYQTFETAPNAPAVVTGTASSITRTTAILNATVNPEGGEVTDCHFEYGTSSSYGSSVPCEAAPGSGTSPVAVSAEVEGLSDSATYHFRISATNVSGTLAGADESFTTLPPPPVVTKVKPAKGPASGRATVTITGANLSGATAVRFGSTSAAAFFVNSATKITAFSPTATAGTVDVTVETSGGSSATSSADHYRFVPAITGLSVTSGSTAGGTSVTVTGAGFAVGSSATSFKFGTAKAIAVNCSSSTSCTVTSPAHTAGTVDVKATVSKLSSPKAVADRYTYH